MTNWRHCNRSYPSRCRRSSHEAVPVVNHLEVLHIVGMLLVWIAAAMLPSTVLAATEGVVVPWVGAAGITCLVGSVLWFATPKRVSINPREGIAVVGLGWLSVVLAGSLPFAFTGSVPHYPAALFESVSGFTTTGATVFPAVEGLPRSILLWRSVSHWIGGMGIIVLGVAILPLIGMGGAQLFRAEVPGIAADRLKPRIASTARLLWVVYALFTVALWVVYLILGMPFFDAVNHAMSALATGGFSTRDASLGAYSTQIQWITILFMLIAGTNFTLHYRFLTGKWDAWVRNAEWRWFVGAALVSVVAVFIALSLSPEESENSTLLTSAFNVVAVVTTTGFTNADFAVWPAFCQVLLLGLMFMGAMGGSTGGGFKVVRAVVVAKHALSEIRKVLHPRAVYIMKLGGNALKPDVVLNVMAFLALYMATHGIGTFVLAALGNDLVTATSAALAAMSSIGPGLGAVGPASSYGVLGWPEHLTLSALMLLGRLEFYTLLVLLAPGIWSRWGGER